MNNLIRIRTIQTDKEKFRNIYIYICLSHILNLDGEYQKWQVGLIWTAFGKLPINLKCRANNVLETVALRVGSEPLDVP